MIVHKKNHQSKSPCWKKRLIRVWNIPVFKWPLTINIWIGWRVHVNWVKSGFLRLWGIKAALYTVYDASNNTEMIRPTLIFVWPYLRLLSSRQQNTKCVRRERPFPNFRSEVGLEMPKGGGLFVGVCTRLMGTSSWRSTLNSPHSAPTAGRQLFR